MQYWSNVLAILRKKVGAEVIVTAVPGFVFYCNVPLVFLSMTDANMLSLINQDWIHIFQI